MVPFILFDWCRSTLLALIFIRSHPPCVNSSGSGSVEGDLRYIVAVHILEVNGIITEDGFFVITSEEIEFERECFGQIVLRIFHQRHDLRGFVGQVDDRFAVHRCDLSVTVQ